MIQESLNDKTEVRVGLKLLFAKKIISLFISHHLISSELCFQEKIFDYLNSVDS